MSEDDRKNVHPDPPMKTHYEGLRFSNQRKDEWKVILSRFIKL
jgi:hypothetical protein